MMCKFLSLPLVLFVMACVPDMPDPATPEPAAATEDCYSEGVVNGYALQPGQYAIDPSDGDVPSYVDIVRVESTLEGETLAAVFFLRELPEELAFNRKGIHQSAARHVDAEAEVDFSVEYMWYIHIDADGDSEGSTEFSFFKSEYTFMAYYYSGKDSEPAIRPVRDTVQIVLLEVDPDNPTHLSEVFRVRPSLSLSFSHEEDTITMTGEVPGISSESYLQFEAMDLLMTANVVDVDDSFDKVSCRPSAGHA